MSADDHLSGPQFYYHGSRHEFQPGDMLSPQGKAARNFKDPKSGNHVYFTQSLAMASWAASEAPDPHPGATGHLYQVAPTGRFNPDPTMVSEDGGNPTGSFRTKQPLRVLREVQPHELVYDDATRKTVDQSPIHPD